MPPFPHVPGVYAIVNLVNYHLYVGSSLDLYKRRQGHLIHLRQKKHHNRHLQAAYDLYGEDAFAWYILEFVADHQNLEVREQFYLDTWKPTYNLSPTAGTPRGVKHTEATKEKLATAKRGKPGNRRGIPQSKEAREKMSRAAKNRPSPMAGKTHSDATRQKISRTLKANPPPTTPKKLAAVAANGRARKGKKFTPEQIARMSLSRKGKGTGKRKPHTAEAKRKMSEALKGRKPTEETRKKLSIAHSNPSAETRKKLSDGTRAVWAQRHAVELAKHLIPPSPDSIVPAPRDITLKSLWDDMDMSS
ncbi:MAG TPA: NUMOD3 domain-containing DNA-binding protein [Ktedonobacteraceae bacterium]|nr:NUMOD3 domain-containing DNA-binding protein [Ktedonobacteraceae bacterium]